MHIRCRFPRPTSPPLRRWPIVVLLLAYSLLAGAQQQQLDDSSKWGRGIHTAAVRAAYYFVGGQLAVRVRTTPTADGRSAVKLLARFFLSRTCAQRGDGQVVV